MAKLLDGSLVCDARKAKKEFESNPDTCVQFRQAGFESEQS
jgi:hypothetical protein